MSSKGCNQSSGKRDDGRGVLAGGCLIFKKMKGEAYEGREEQGEFGEADTREQENRADFVQRGHREGYKVVKGALKSWGSRRSVHSQTTETARETEQELNRLGIPTIIVNGNYLENDGKSIYIHIVDESETVGYKYVAINNYADLPYINMAWHEAYHYWKTRRERESFTEYVLSKAKQYGKAFVEYQQLIADTYFEGEINLEDDVCVDFYEELIAFISGNIYEGEYDNKLSEMFKDYDAVRDAVYDFYSKMSGVPKEELMNTEIDSAEGIYDDGDAATKVDENLPKSAKVTRIRHLPLGKVSATY